MIAEAKIGASEGSLQDGRIAAISAGVGQRTRRSVNGINKDCGVTIGETFYGLIRVKIFLIFSFYISVLSAIFVAKQFNL